MRPIISSSAQGIGDETTIMSTVQPVKIHGYVKTSDVNWHLIVLKVPQYVCTCCQHLNEISTCNLRIFSSCEMQAYMQGQSYFPLICKSHANEMHDQPHPSQGMRLTCNIGFTQHILPRSVCISIYDRAHGGKQRIKGLSISAVLTDLVAQMRLADCSPVPGPIYFIAVKYGSVLRMPQAIWITSKGMQIVRWPVFSTHTVYGLINYMRSLQLGTVPLVPFQGTIVSLESSC